MPLTVATFNINGINTRLPNLLEWLDREHPDVVCLQELKATDQQFPARELHEAGYHAIWRGEPRWNGVAILARVVQPIEIRRALPGQDNDPHARYLEAAVQGVIIAGLYLPNGNPIRGPKFKYKLAWFESLIRHAQGLYDSGAPVVLAGDFNVVPTVLPSAARVRRGRFAVQEVSARAGVHVLGLLPRPLEARRGAVHRSSAAQRRAGAAVDGRRRRRLGSRSATRERSRADVDQAARGGESDSRTGRLSSWLGFARRTTRLPAEFFAFNEYRVALCCCQAQCLQLTVLLRIIPAVRLFEARKLDEHGKNGPPLTLHDITLAADGEKAPAVTFDCGKNAFLVLIYLRRVGHFQDIEKAVCRHIEPP
jgi:hypothetical protein